MKLRTILLSSLFLLFGQSVALCSGYYITQEQMTTLQQLVESMKQSNNNMTQLLVLQQNELETLQKNYNERYTLAQEQQQTLTNYSQKLESRNSIYKYGLIVVGVLAFSLGVVVAK